MQLEVALHADRFPVIGGGERGGKTFVTAALALPHIILMPEMVPAKFYDEDGNLKFDHKRSRPRSPHVVIFGPTYMEPREEFKLIEGWLNDLGLLCDVRNVNAPSKPQDGPWSMVTKQGVVIRTWSMEDSRSIRAVDAEFAIVAEAGKCPYDGIERVNGRVSGTKGFIIYSGTMEDSQQWYQDWMLMGKRANDIGIVSYSLPTWSNVALYPTGESDPEIQRLRKLYPEDTFAMRVAAEPRPPRLRVLKEMTSEHIQRIAVPLDADVEIWIDPGYASAYALLWVAIWEEAYPDGERRKRFHVFDEFYEQGLTTDDMVDLCRARPKLWARVRQCVIDVAAQGHRDAGESALEKWKAKSPGKSWNLKYWREAPLIERIRVSAKMMQVTVDPRCRGLIAECGLGEPVFPEMHPWKYNSDRDGRITSERPVDKWNHSAKALGYGLLHHLGQVETLRRPQSVNRLQKNAPARSVFGMRKRPVAAA